MQLTRRCHQRPRIFQIQVATDDLESCLAEHKKPEKELTESVTAQPEIATGVMEFFAANHSTTMDPKVIRSSTRLAIGFCSGLFLFAMILVPFSLYGSDWVFSRADFRGWCIFSFIWVWYSMFVCVFWPLIESSLGREIILLIIKKSFSLGKQGDA